MIRKFAHQAFSVVFLSVLFLPTIVSAYTASDLEARIAELLIQMQTLESELNTVKGTTQTSTPPPVASTPLLPKTTLSFTPFNTFLHKDSEGPEVAKLQRFLAQYPDIYPEGTISGYFGSLTEAAVKRFQRTYGIVSTGAPTVTGYGLLGIRTREKLNELIAQNAAKAKATAASTLPPSAVSGTSSQSQFLRHGSEGIEVTKLQTYLAKDPSLYPEGLISGYFGSLTEAAVKRFQQKYGIVSSGTPESTGYGMVGPKTRAKLDELMASVTTAPPQNTTTPNANNTAPSVTITANATASFSASVPFAAQTADDGRPFNTLTIAWSKADGPGTVTFSNTRTANTEVSFSETGMYHIKATVSDGVLSASDTVAINITSAPAPTTPATTTPLASTPTLTFTATPASLTKGATTTLTWSTTNVATCTASNGWSGSKATSGSATLSPIITTTYALSCTGTGGNTVAKEVIVTVTAAITTTNPHTPYNTTAIALPGTLQAEHFDKDGEGIAYHETDTTNNGGAFRTTEGVDIQNTQDTGGGYDIGWTKGGEWLEYSVNVTTAGTYVLDARVASNGAGGTFHVEMDGTDITNTLTVPDTGDWQNWTTITSPSFSLTAGSHVLRIAMDTSSSVTSSIANFNFLTVRVPGATSPALTGDAVSLYGTWEKLFTNTKSYSNPYDFNEIQLNAVFTAPSGKKVNFFGFHDGNGNGGQTGNVWKLRFLADETGTWTYTYSWSDGTSGGSGSFTAANDGKYKGILKPYTVNPHWLAYNGTTPVFLKSYYLISGDFTGIPIDWAASNVYQKILDRGYNHLQLNMLPIGYVEQDFTDSPSNFATPLWGTDPVTDQRMNVWKRMEEHVRWLDDRNVGIQFFMGFDPKPTSGYNDPYLYDPNFRPGAFSMKRWASMSSSEKERYVKYVVARLAPYANIAGWNHTWEVTDDGHFELASLLQQYDVWGHLRTYHDESPYSNSFADSRYNFAAIENHLDNWTYPSIARDSYSHHETTLVAYKGKPVFMAEGNGLWRSCYYSEKYGRDLLTFEEIGEGIRRSAWGVTTAAGSFTWDDLPSCETNGSSDVFSVAPAVESISILHSIMENDVVFYKLSPHDELLSNINNIAYVLAEPGQQYLVFAEGGSSFDLSIANGTYTATWINTQTNARQNANGGSVTGGTRSFTPPNSGDWVLVLKK